MPYRKKLIELALPLDVINQELACEKSIRHGHSNTLHFWMACMSSATSSGMLTKQKIRFDTNAQSCYKLTTSPLFLREQGARRLTPASAFLSISFWVRSTIQGKR
jgi:hypothetical protein